MMTVLALVAVAGLGVLYTNRVESHLQCQARYNETNNARTRALTEATEKERAADRAEDKARADLVTHPAVLKPLADRTAVEREQLRALTVVWQRTLTEEQVQQAAADAERREHPVPPPPSEVCG
ncbi:MAG TPA: hypothetical protein VFT95_09060 [Micromonosporaceae bacterium]|nr:hypothetical protein [Micromonosporaceae bacterium]